MGVLRRTADQVDRTLGHVLSAVLALSVLAVLWQVVSRYLLADPSSFTDELVRYLLIWLGILGGAYAAGRRLHLAIDLVPSRLGPTKRRRLETLIYLLILLFSAAVLVYGGTRLVLLTLALGQRSPALDLPLGWVYAVLPLAGVTLCLHSLAGVFDPAGSEESLDGEAP